MSTDYQANKAAISIVRQEYYVQNRDRILAERRTAYASLTLEEKKELGQASRIRELWSRYRLTLGQYNDMLAEQGNKCACCERVFGESRELRPCVDHDHQCCSGPVSCGQCVRALLCCWCNRIIGIIEKNPCLVKYITKGETL
jgi:hypothetical protein